mgnify:FL=1
MATPVVTTKKVKDNGVTQILSEIACAADGIAFECEREDNKTAAENYRRCSAEIRELIGRYRNKLVCFS